MRVLIMAGGEDAKWANHLGVRRHFAPIGREPLLVRTVRQFRERGIADIRVICPDLPEYAIDGVTTIRPDFTEWGHEALNGVPAWDRNGRTIQVYGDTVFTDSAMDVVTGFDRRVFQAFGRHGPGGVSRWGELFAISFWPAQAGLWFAAVQNAFALKRRGIIRRAGSWEGYRIMGGAQGSEIGRHRLYAGLFTEINDATDDFDTVEEYEALTKLYGPAKDPKRSRRRAA